MSDKVNTGNNMEDKKLIKNARKPEGKLGHEILDRMNKSHETMARWGVSHFNIDETDKILDIGCGGGKNLERFAKQIGKDGCVVGIDYSEVSVEKSTDLNKQAIDDDGLVFFCNEAVYREGKMDKYEDLIELLDMKIYSEDVLKSALEKAGFKDFKAFIQDENEWICVTARKA